MLSLKQGTSKAKWMTVATVQKNVMKN